MSDAKIDSTEEFRACVLAAYRPLLEHGGFAELAARADRCANPFSVRMGNATTVIEVEGINYGAAAWTKIFRAEGDPADYYGLPINALLFLRVPQRTARHQRSEGQRTAIAQDAADIIQYARDVLSGDFEALDAIVEQERQLQQDRLARAGTPRQRAANVACSSAGHAFKRGEYQTVVSLLEPYLDLLLPSQKKRYDIARQRAGKE